MLDWEKRKNKFYLERDKALLTFDLDKIKRVYKKYRDLLMFPYPGHPIEPACFTIKANAVKAWSRRADND